jgi:plasmid stability protein
VPWRPLDGAVDLPCFVQRADLPPKASFVTTVRMETPVIYFYSPAPLTVDVAVGFRNGLMTEFYPRPTSSDGHRPDLLRVPAMSRLEWNGVEVMPGGAAEFPSDGTTNHYYAARAAGAAPVQVGTQREGFLFYRGVGGFELPLRATVNPERGVDIANDGVDPVPALMVFENRGGRVGFSNGGRLGAQVTIPALTLDASIASVRAALLGMLINEGLYVEEAEAMIETWSGSWFEEGTRVFYVVPRRLVDRTLPLNIRPVPAGVERVFIGRLEVATPELLDDLHDALTALDRDRLATYGRFLEPFSRRILDRGLPAAERARIVAALAAATEALQTPVASSCEAITLSSSR